MALTADDARLLLPEGTRLVHIGPPKTGTTALQGAFHAGREAVLAQGVRYAGSSRHSVSAVLAVTGRPSFSTDGEPPPMWQWRALVHEIRRARQGRVVLSSEFFADAEPASIRTIAHDLDSAHLHVLVTLRPLARIVPSQWQQYVQSGMRVSFERWLDAMFNKPPGTLTPTFWQRHRHDRLVARWAEVVGAQNVTVMVLDRRDQATVLRVAERLVGLADGTLVAQDDVTNRSMTLPEIETVRAFNIAFMDEGLDASLLSTVMHFGAATYMKLREPAADEPRIETPQWALDRAGEIAREMVDAIGASGVRVIGDLEDLTEVPSSGLAGGRLPEVHVAPEVSAAAAMGVLVASGLAPGVAATRHLGPERDGEPPELAGISTSRLIGVLPRRVVRAAARRWSAGRRRFDMRRGKP